MKKLIMLVVLSGAALGLVGCASTSKVPQCKGKYEQVNTPDKYPQPEATP